MQNSPVKTFLLIDKPANMTSHDVVDYIRKITQERCVGHAGTLDPFATGLLIVGVGRESTKHLGTFLGLPKTYTAIIRLGESSTTLDPEGKITDASLENDHSIIVAQEDLRNALQKLTGNLQQIPPMHSAIKIGGQKLYNLARQGIHIDRPARPVTVSRFDLEPTFVRDALPFALPYNLPVIIDCSSGTYIRALARDLGELLHTQAYLTTLRRTAIGPYTIHESTPLEQITTKNWRHLAKSLQT